jgi:hypothetical protein
MYKAQTLTQNHVHRRSGLNIKQVTLKQCCLARKMTCARRTLGNGKLLLNTDFFSGVVINHVNVNGTKTKIFQAKSLGT